MEINWLKIVKIMGAVGVSFLIVLIFDTARERIISIVIFFVGAGYGYLRTIQKEDEEETR